MNEPGGIRTHDLLIRSQTLYPAELRAHVLLISDSDAILSQWVSFVNYFFSVKADKMRGAQHMPHPPQCFNHSLRHRVLLHQYSIPYLWVFVHKGHTPGVSALLRIFIEEDCPAGELAFQAYIEPVKNGTNCRVFRVFLCLLG